MHRKIREYKLVRCEGRKAGAGRKIGRRCALAGLLSLALVVAVIPPLGFPRQSTVVAAPEQPLSDISGGAVTGGDRISGTADGADCVSAGDMISGGVALSGAEFGRAILKNVLHKELSREDILVALDAGHGGEIRLQDRAF